MAEPDGQPLPQLTGLFVGGGVNLGVGSGVVGVLLGTSDVDGGEDKVGPDDGNDDKD